MKLPECCVVLGNCAELPVKSLRLVAPSPSKALPNEESVELSECCVVLDRMISRKREGKKET